MEKAVFHITTVNEDGKEDVLEVFAYSAKQAADFAPIPKDCRIVNVEQAATKASGFAGKGNLS